MIVFFIWIILSFVVAAVANNKKIGAGNAFLLSIFLSPLIGFIITLVSDPLPVPANEFNSVKVNQSWEETFAPKPPEEKKDTSVITELERITNLKIYGHITNDEFNVLKQNILTPPTPPNQN